MQFIVSADDYGLTAGITDQILDCVDNGVLTSVSIMANGGAFEHAITAYKKRPGLRLSIHLNLLEGKPVLPPQDVGLLVDKNGEFCHSFVSLWLKYILGSKADREALARQVQAEVRAQVAKVRGQVAQDVPVNIDGHLHAHMIPFVFDAVCALTGEYKLAYVRLPMEPAIWGEDWLRNIRAYASANGVKHILLNFLSRRALPRLRERGIGFCDHFVGLLYSGSMDVYAVRGSLRQIRKAPAGAIVEVLFHPFQAPTDEEHIWHNRPAFLKYYRSPQRQCEKNTLKDRTFQTLVQKERA